ncbi:MAG TPA: DUF2283 domain-containing protein [Thermoanaerobaculia bacterium]|jgi:uncharacterized protein YuzE|nr:DUF2283 domain-containing protein [Thermoanaerobaculia bacterium]
MRYEYDDQGDSLFIRFREGDYSESEEIYPGFVIDFDKSGRPIALDIYYDASKFVDIAALKQNVAARDRNADVEESPAPMFINDAPLDEKR